MILRRNDPPEELLKSEPPSGNTTASPPHIDPLGNDPNPNDPSPSTTMSFGFGVGDFLAAGRLVWDVYSAYADAPEKFHNFSQEILALHVVVRKVEDLLGLSDPDGGSQLPAVGSSSGSQPPIVSTLSTKYKEDLMILYDQLQAIMKDLVGKKYKHLQSSRNPIDRFKWRQVDLVGLMDKLRSKISLLTVRS